jgi:hypothetical protein
VHLDESPDSETYATSSITGAFGATRRHEGTKA